MEKMFKRPTSNKNPALSHGQRLIESALCSSGNPICNKANDGPCMPNLPVGDTPYVKAKHVQMEEKDPEKAIALFRAAINVGDRVDSALKDMARVMKQQNRPEEAIEAIISLRNRCSDQAQESLDNVLLDLYKSCGRLDEQILLLNHKLELIDQGLLFNGKATKTAKSHGKKFKISIEQESTRLLGNLGWAYMQQSNYIAAEATYRKSLAIDLDNNKLCNLGICLMHQGRAVEAKTILQNVKPASADAPEGLDSHLKSYERAQEMLRDLEGKPMNYNLPDANSAVESLECFPCPSKQAENQENDYEKLNSDSVNSEDTRLHSTSGSGPSEQNYMISS